MVIRFVRMVNIARAGPLLKARSDDPEPRRGELGRDVKVISPGRGGGAIEPEVAAR
jgi:hypothetical protein